jgi:NTE family protein
MPRFLLLLAAVVLGGCTTLSPVRTEKPSVPPTIDRTATAESAPVPAPARPRRIALVLGGGAARGFAHVGVIKALEANGIRPDFVVGTSVGSLVGALYAAGYGGFDLQRIALTMDEGSLGDWTLPDRGVFKGEYLQTFVNQAVQNRPLERLNMPLGIVATDLRTGQAIVFRQGNAGMAVRASSSIPGVFQPVVIAGREYVDGGLVSPVPVQAARSMGADFVIAVDISNHPEFGNVRDTVGVLLQTFAIMGRGLVRHEAAGADIVLRPDIGGIRSTDFESRQRAIFEGERAVLRALVALQQKLALR